MNLPRQDLQHIMDHTRDLWEDLRGTRLFITGGTGFFGHWLIESFIYANQQLDLKASASILTRQPASAQQAFPHLFSDPAITLLKGDVRNFEFPRGEYSHIIHAATDASAKLNEENPLLMLDTIIEGTRHTLDFAIHAKTEKFLLTSSGAVYGKQPSNVTHIPEEYNGAPDPLDPKSAYGIGKKTAEHLCTLYTKQHGLHTAIARCFAFVGPYLLLDAHFAIGNFILDGLNNRPILIKGDGTPYRSYLYAADLAVWLWTILIRGASEHPYNVGSEESVSITETAYSVTRSTNPNLAVLIRGGTPNPTAPKEQYIPSTKRARNELGLHDCFGLDEKIRRTIAYLQGANSET